MQDRTARIVETRAQVRRLFAPADRLGHQPPSIGIEAEFLVFHASGVDRGSVPIDRVTRVLAQRSGLRQTARTSFEPGGQLELSPAPQPSVALATRQIAQLSGEVRSLLRQDGIDIAASGVDQWRSPEVVGLQTRQDRYVVMQRHFDAIGPAGRRMMRQTASLQVCVDLAAGPDGVRQWLVANLIGPALAAAFRNSSPGTNRTAIWLAVDSSRTGLDGHQIDERRPVDAYLEFALRAEVMPLPRPGSGGADLPFRMPFARWAIEGGPRPDAPDIAHHLSTLFPPVRPRGGYLEVRFLDAQPPERVETATALIAILLADPVAREQAIEITGGDPSRLAAAWRTSADRGLGDGRLRDTALELVAAAAARVRGISRRWPGWLPSAAARSLETFGQTVADQPPLAYAS
jgi:glutamate--cysteine ligase